MLAHSASQFSIFLNFFPFLQELYSDVVGHQADLRFINMAAHKFMEDFKSFHESAYVYKCKLTQPPGQSPRLSVVDFPDATEIKDKVGPAVVA